LLDIGRRFPWRCRRPIFAASTFSYLFSGTRTSLGTANGRPPQRRVERLKIRPGEPVAPPHGFRRPCRPDPKPWVRDSAPPFKAGLRGVIDVG
jgi:hypothetical protein